MRNSLQLSAVALLLFSCSQPKPGNIATALTAPAMDAAEGFQSLAHRLPEPIPINIARLVKDTPLGRDSAITVTPLVELEGRWYRLGLRCLRPAEALNITYHGTYYLMLSGGGHAFARRLVFWDKETVHLEDAIAL